MIRFRFGRLFSCNSMSSIDEYLRNRSSNLVTCPNFESLVQDNAVAYSTALRQLLNAHENRYCCDNCTDYIARKICSTRNDDIGAFLDELKKIASNGYSFNTVMINLLMNHCIEHFDMNFHQFVLTRIVNKRTPEMDLVNEEILQKFVNKRLNFGLQQRQTLGMRRRKL